MRKLTYNNLLARMERSMPADADICKNTLGISADKIHETVIIAPGWEPHKIPSIGKAELLVESGPLFGFCAISACG